MDDERRTDKTVPGRNALKDEDSIEYSTPAKRRTGLRGPSKNLSLKAQENVSLDRKQFLGRLPCGHSYKWHIHLQPVVRFSATDEVYE